MNLGQLKQFGEMQVNMMQKFVDLVDRVQELEKENRRLQEENEELNFEIEGFESEVEALRLEIQKVSKNVNDLPKGFNVGDRVYIKNTTGETWGTHWVDGKIGVIVNERNQRGELGGTIGVNVKLEEDGVVWRVKQGWLNKVNP